MCIGAVSDASHGNEEIYLDEWEIREPFRSQGAKLIFLASPELISDDSAHVHLISFSSTVLDRVVNSTIKAETYQLRNVQESADLIRAAIVHMHGLLDETDWERSAADGMRSVWFTDCKSCYDTLQKPIHKTVDKRLGIELASLRQHLWRDSGSHIPLPRMIEHRPATPSDTLKWIDTQVMVADCLTKSMKEDLLVQVINDNRWCYGQHEDAKEAKRRRQSQRKAARDRKHTVATADPEQTLLDESDSSEGDLTKFAKSNSISHDEPHTATHTQPNEVHNVEVFALPSVTFPYPKGDTT